MVNGAKEALEEEEEKGYGRRLGGLGGDITLWIVISEQKARAVGFPPTTLKTKDMPQVATTIAKLRCKH